MERMLLYEKTKLKLETLFEKMDKKKLTVLWTSGDREVAIKVVLAYIDFLVQKRLWREIDLLIWGPSVRVAGMDRLINERLKALSVSGVKIQACEKCASEYDTVEALRQAGVTMAELEPLLNHLVENQENLVSL